LNLEGRKAGKHQAECGHFRFHDTGVLSFSCLPAFQIGKLPKTVSKLALAAEFQHSRIFPNMKLPLACFLALSVSAFAQTKSSPADPDANAPASSPAQNRAQKLFPPKGVEIPEKDRAELTAGAAELGKEIAALKSAKLKPELSALLPDVEVFHKAVDWALRYDEFYNVKEVVTARTLLAEGKARAAALREGKAPWTTQTGPVVRGYRSKIDGSVQPFGVVVPKTWTGPADKTPRPTWIWNHGRGDTLSELSFIAGRLKSAGEFATDANIVIHPYGRYCNATKFAGEVDVFEALDAAARAYPVDRSRLVNAGFSMGGASAWHLGVHHSGLWAVTHTGAGFAETAEYAGVFAAGKTPPPWWEVILYRWYDATVAVANFANHPILAYHGSEDKQGQSTVIMKRFAEKEHVNIEEFIGPGVGHKYEAKTKEQIAAKISSLLEKGRTEIPKTIHLSTHSLVQNSAAWMSIERLERSWERADLDATIDSTATLHVKTKNVDALRFIGSNVVPGSLPVVKAVELDGQKVAISLQRSTDFRPLAVVSKPVTTFGFVKKNGAWVPDSVPSALQSTLSKSAIVCGPIDHAFMSEFLFVKPSGAAMNSSLGEWTQCELAHATKQWRAIFRGDAPTVDDSKLTHEQIQNSNLILWGDPSSNAVLKKIADKLPVKWTKDGLEFGGKKYDAATHMPILIFPNPLNPRRYVVLNSGFTFSRACASGTNSLQTPKLPDWAIVDTTVPPDDKFPGKIVDAGFFDEQWRFTTERPK
jgi:predicted esterase